MIGRNLAQCKATFESLRQSLYPPGQLPTPQHHPQQPPHTFNPVYPSAPHKRPSMNTGPEQTDRDSKRRKSGTQTPTSAYPSHGPVLAPRPSNGGSPGLQSMPPSSAPSSGKKRGRPSKLEVERKQREAIERGEIIPSGSVAVSQGQEGARPGSFAPVTIAPAPAIRSPRSVMTPTQMSSSQVVDEQGPSMTTSTEAPGKKRKPRQTPKLKVNDFILAVR